MVTARKIRCVVVVADAESDRMPKPTTPRFRPSDLLPWADPHIRSLVEQLQNEVRQESASRQAAEAEAAAIEPFDFEAKIAELEGAAKHEPAATSPVFDAPRF